MQLRCKRRRGIREHRQRHETYTEFGQLFERDHQIGERPAPTIQPPHQHHIDLRRRADTINFSRSSRSTAPEPTSSI